MNINEIKTRRSNRGNNLLKLINQERNLLNQTGESELVANNDADEDVITLLFNEDEDDDDMEVENDELDSNDDKFSASESSSYDEDSDYSEEEDENKKKRDKKSKSKVGFKRNKDIPILIKRVARTKPKKVEKPSTESTEPIDLLDTENRRTSSRKSALANRLKVYNNLKEKEQIRIKNFEKINASRSKRVEVKLTQEDRMREALETEKINVASLQRFQEVEIYQQLKREEQHLKKKIKFSNFEKIMRFSSDETLISPEDDERLYEVQKQFLLKRLNRGARKKYLEEETQKQQKINELLGLNEALESADSEVKADSISPEEPREITELTLQGPCNKVSRNLLTLYNFNSTEKMSSLEFRLHFNFGLPKGGISDFERIVHCKKAESEPLLYESSSENKLAKSQIQAVMSQFAKFGDFDNHKRTAHVTTHDQKSKSAVRALKFTLAPSLFYKSTSDNSNSNVKKSCYVKCNEKVKYIDPKLNISYSDLDVYRTLNRMINNEGGFKWISLDASNDHGMYYCGETEPAEGVPPGF